MTKLVCQKPRNDEEERERVSREKVSGREDSFVGRNEVTFAVGLVRLGETVLALSFSTEGRHDGGGCFPRPMLSQTAKAYLPRADWYVVV